MGAGQMLCAARVPYGPGDAIQKERHVCWQTIITCFPYCLHVAVLLYSLSRSLFARADSPVLSPINCIARTSLDRTKGGTATDHMLPFAMCKTHAPPPFLNTSTPQNGCRLVGQIALCCKRNWDKHHASSLHVLTQAP